jgi:hypothetical protein
MLLDGDTIFIGDSITVGLAPFVFVAGNKSDIAKVGADTAQILRMVRSAEDLRAFDFQKNAVVLGGTNDIGGGLSAEAIFGNLMAIWKVCKDHGLRVVALTVPPAKGYSGFASNFPAINAKRKQVNAMIMASPLADTKIDLDTLLGAPTDQDRLALGFDSGDHLHPIKLAMGGALTAELAKPSSTSVTPQASISPAPAGPNTLLVGGAIAGASWGIFKLGRSRGWF